MICQAAFEGLVDFSQARLLDRLWWKRLGIMLDRLEKKNYLALVHLQHTQHCAALNYLAGKKAFDLHWDQCNSIVSSIRRSYFPWSATEEDSTDELVSRLRDEWAANFGDPDDPETKARIQQTVDFLNSK